MAMPASQMITANRLKDGDVLYWKAGVWVLDIQHGEVFRDEATAEAALDASAKFETDNVVIKPYLFEVRQDAPEKGGAIHPVKEREIIRAAGPTVRTDTGKQAGQVHA